jgi:putative transposase
MHLEQAPKHHKHHRLPVSIISHAVWRYYRFNDSYRDIAEELAYRGIIVSHETIRSWCIKFAAHFKDVIKKRERNPSEVSKRRNSRRISLMPELL